MPLSLGQCGTVFSKVPAFGHVLNDNFCTCFTRVCVCDTAFILARDLCFSVYGLRLFMDQNQARNFLGGRQNLSSLPS